MKSKKKIAFIFALPIRTSPILITMPFGLNVIQLLDRQGFEIDIFLSEYRSDAYEKQFSDRVTLHFLDHNYYWPKEGKWSYYALTSYFRYLCTFQLRNKYSHIFASGMGGITLGGILKSVNRKSTFVYLNDEFPVQGVQDIWVKGEIKAAQKADVVCTPDEYRYAPLCAQIPGLEAKPHFTLPNTPLLEAIQEIPRIDWHAEFGLTPDKKLFLMAGGLAEFLQIEELMLSVRDWPEEAVLIMKGKHDVKRFRESLEHLNIPGKIVWSVESYSPEKLHSLIQYCAASICLYEGINENLAHVGKSSGKMMRSLLLGKPVIVSRQASFQFVEDAGIGVLVDTADEIALAVGHILSREEAYHASCTAYYPKISFEHYWTEFEKAVF